jgi:hypothetical protein
VRPGTRRALGIAVGLLIAAMLGCWAAAGWFDARKHDLAGVPTSHFAVTEDGRYFYVPRGGPPVEQRPHVAMTAEQYRLWEENDGLSNTWGAAGVLCFFAAVGVVIWLRLAGPAREPAAEPGAVPEERP